MDFLTDRNYSFVSKALASETFAVVDIKGEEGLSRCYRFEILLVAENAELDMDSLLRSSAKFTIHRSEEDDIEFHGILASFEQQHAVGNSVFYRAVLVPRLWRLNLTHHHQVFLDMTVKEIAETVLKDGGLTSQDFEFRLQAAYHKLTYVCQYRETHLNFISRWLAREGIYYYFEQTDGGEKVIITDTAIAHQESPHGKELAYSPPSGLIDTVHNEVVLGLVCRHKTLPRTVRLKDYNYRKPSLEVTASAIVDEKSSGEVYLYGEHFRSPEEGERLAKVRAQELLCCKQTFIGDSTVPYVSPGYTFTLSDHYRRSFNQKYLTVEITHEGSQAGFLISGLQQGLSEREKKSFYRNQFTAIVANTQFRAPQTADKPKITGTLNAKIDAAGSGKYAELDEHGRYKVILPFDLSGRKDGKASVWLRMAQPYAGSGHGMHFPLHKGAEVLLTFIEGNPDRPVIAAAVPNPEAPSPVTASDQTMAKITTSGGNKIHIEDKDGNQRILVHSPTSGTFLRLGAPNDPDHEEDESESEEKEMAGAKLYTKDALKIVAGSKNEIIFGEEGVAVIGNHNKWVGGLATDIMVGMEVGLKIGGEVKFSPWHHEFREEKTKLHQVKTELTEQITRLEESNTRLRGRVDDLVDDVVTLINEKTTLQTNYNRMVEDMTRLEGNVTQMSEVQTRLSGEVTTLSESTTRLDSTVLTLCDSVVEMRENEVKLAQDISTVAEIQTVLSENINTIAALNNML